ncbi:rab3 GTPase-activating protein catalytic subunit isoform X1 [Vigna radiata var. radiata]|uniref:Rab3 GTPase-activating protein catalytic subunit isoform X1 n=2 Tax=Vigna radiata var. radiata TaxID=3916 RepID=A0A1S3UGP9_VIGRR|nr:rab3 GTPase-activating protein catalytic subunit isoform X1 [Vigna radiata var. radiata]XP_022637553.1 rab3 GTPase-activating protein catalytic subunit isoform X1 [Vigna radiata var. radiata]
MEEHTFVSKARIAFHSAAAKAERVLMDFKSDREDHDRHSSQEADSPNNNIENESKEVRSELKHKKWRPPHIGIKQDWQDRIKNIGRGRKEVEDTDKVGDANMAVPFYDDNLYTLNVKNEQDAKASELFPSVESLTAATKDPLPPSSVLKQLAVAVEAGSKVKSMKEFIASSGGSSPAKERAGLSLSAVKALVLREKEDGQTSEFTSNEKVVQLISSLFDPEGDFLTRKIDSNTEETAMTSLPRDIHGAPPESLVVKLAEILGNYRTVRKMALFWCCVVAEVRKLWSEEQHLPGVPKNEIPDLNSCLLYQHFQLINCCISRKRFRVVATESLDSMVMQASSDAKESSNYNAGAPASPVLYARLNSGELVLRLGANHPAGDMTLLETGEPVYSPVTQDGPLLTEDLIRETEEFVLRTGSVGAGCSQLLSDMQAFKAANPGCILEDFVRWHSPPDWTDNEASVEDSDVFDSGESLSAKGQLSRRMQKEGNLWRELWETSKPVPAVKQAPLFDEDLAVEGILHAFEDIHPSDLFVQLFVSLLGLGFAIAEPMLSSNSDFSKLFYDCKEYIIAACQSNKLHEKVDDLVQAYETVERMLLNPEEALKMIKQTDESTMVTDEPKSPLKRLRLIFAGKDKLLRKSLSKDQLNDDEKPGRQSFSSFFDSKSSLFSKKPPKSGSPSPAEKSSLDVSWTSA